MKDEHVTDAVERLLDVLDTQYGPLWSQSQPIRDAIALVYRAYCRDKAARGELVSDYPTLDLRLVMERMV